MRTSPARATVPCGSCNLCCRMDAITLHPDHGDDVGSYHHEIVVVPIFGTMPVIKKVDGHCIYLVDSQCSIWHRAPVICRTFDCRDMYRRTPRAERRRMVKAGIADQSVFDAGRDRLPSLEQSEIA